MYNQQRQTTESTFLRSPVLLTLLLSTTQQL